MKYIVCEKPGEFILKEKEAPIRKENEALLQINKVGICGTDLHAYGGNQAFFTYPRILGHELASTVLEIGDNPKGINAIRELRNLYRLPKRKNKLLYQHQSFRRSR